MSVMWTIIGFIVILAFLFLIFAVVRSAAQSDHMPNYDEEYASDLGRDGEDAGNYPPVIERTGCLCHS